MSGVSGPALLYAQSTNTGNSISSSANPAQTKSTGQTKSTIPAENTFKFPIWVQDTRRAEIVAFGAFPFAMLFAQMGMDIARTIQHHGDSAYYPWPAKTANSVEMTSHERMITIYCAVGLSVLVSILDQIIHQVKRHRVKQEEAELPGGTPIIIEKPYPGGASNEADSGKAAPSK